jgi:hypothetical protein
MRNKKAPQGGMEQAHTEKKRVFMRKARHGLEGQGGIGTHLPYWLCQLLFPVVPGQRLGPTSPSMVVGEAGVAVCVEARLRTGTH